MDSSENGTVEGGRDVALPSDGDDGNVSAPHPSSVLMVLLNTSAIEETVVRRVNGGFGDEAPPIALSPSRSAWSRHRTYRWFFAQNFVLNKSQNSDRESRDLLNQCLDMEKVPKFRPQKSPKIPTIISPKILTLISDLISGSFKSLFRHLNFVT